MPALAYFEEADFTGDQITDSEIAKCEDEAQLRAWIEDCEAVCEDIKGQLEAAVLGESANPTWVYRCGKSMGFYRRAQSRVRSRMLALGFTPPDHKARVLDALRKVDEIKARSGVALHFMRLAQDGAMPRHEYARLEAEAMACVERARAAARQVRAA